MSYPQPIASGEVLQGSEYFRLFSVLESAGDVYEMDVSAKAFVIGPQSDISRVRVTSWDPELPGSVQSFIVSVDDPFLGRVDNFGSQKYPISNGPARVLISPEDFFTEWRPTPNAFDLVTRVNPSIDLLAYLTAPAATPAKRADFIQKGRLTIRAGGTGVTTLLYPYFRRKYASIEVTNFSVAQNFAIDINGIVFTPDGPLPGTVSTDVNAAKIQMTPVLAAGAIPAAAAGVPITPTNQSFEVKASVDGLFDYLMIQFTGILAGIDGATNPSVPYYTVRFTDEEV